MVQGNGPCIAPVSDAIPAYAEAPIGKQVPIGAYCGIPLNDADGGLFGTLCGIDPQAQGERLVDQLPLIELLGKLPSSYLVAELKLTAVERRIFLQDLEGLVDQGLGAFTKLAMSLVGSPFV